MTGRLPGILMVTQPWRSPGHPLEFPMAVDTATQRSHVRSWEHDGSGGTLSGSVRNGHRARLDLSDVQERPMTAALHERALSSHRGGQGFKSPQLHPETAGQRQHSSHRHCAWEPLWEPSCKLGFAADVCEPGRCLTPWFWFLGDTLRTRFR